MHICIRNDHYYGLTCVCVCVCEENNIILFVYFKNVHICERDARVVCCMFKEFEMFLGGIINDRPTNVVWVQYSDIFCGLFNFGLTHHRTVTSNVTTLHSKAIATTMCVHHKTNDLLHGHVRVLRMKCGLHAMHST